jgi:hypothetical protein
MPLIPNRKVYKEQSEYEIVVHNICDRILNEEKRAYDEEIYRIYTTYKEVVKKLANESGGN